MNIISLIIGILLSFFSTAVMSYIAMATSIGPWIAPTLVLIVMLLSHGLPRIGTTQECGLLTAAGSIGGIMATGMAFSFPTLYFLDPILFNEWMHNIVYFMAILGLISLCAGGLGLLLAYQYEQVLIVQEQLAFPVGKLIYSMISVQNQMRKAYELMLGFVSALIVGVLQNSCRTFLPKTIILVPQTVIGFLSIPVVAFDILPLLWAIGFITGHMIALPLAIGACAKIFLVDPLNAQFFYHLSNSEFILAFCSGMVLQGVAHSFLGLPKLLRSIARQFDRAPSFKVALAHYTACITLEFIGIIFLYFVLFHYLGFPFPAQLFVLVFTILFSYQVAVIAGKMGIAPLGRFATFVMVPAMLFFKLDYVQIVMTATFVEICTGVCADVLFSCKMAQLAHINRKKLKYYQFFGLLVSAFVIGIIFWFLINHFQLGSAELFASKAQSRQLLINARHFSYCVLIIGALFSYILGYCKVNPTLVLGGLLMPLSISLGLVVGGLIAYCAPVKEKLVPFWSGVFAASSLWMLIRAILCL